MSHEITPEELTRLNELLLEGPGDDASEEQVEAFMEKFKTTPGGAAMLQSLTEQIEAGGGELLESLAGVTQSDPESTLVDSSLYRVPSNQARLVAHISEPEKDGSWRRLTLPADASFFDWHFAIEDAFFSEDEGRPYHCFEWRESEVVAAIFCSEDKSNANENEFCEYQNGPLELFSEGVEKLIYCRGEDELTVRLETLLDSQSKDWTVGPGAVCLTGEGKQAGAWREMAFRSPSDFLNP